MGRAVKYTDEQLLDALRECGGNAAGACDLLSCSKSTIRYAIDTREGFLGKVARVRAELAAQGKLDLRAEDRRKGNKTRVEKLRKANPKGTCKPIAEPLGEAARVCLRGYNETRDGGDRGPGFSPTQFSALACVSVLIERVTYDNWREVYATMIGKLVGALRRFPVDGVAADVDDFEVDD